MSRWRSRRLVAFLVAMFMVTNVVAAVDVCVHRIEAHLAAASDAHPPADHASSAPASDEDCCDVLKADQRADLQQPTAPFAIAAVAVVQPLPGWLSPQALDPVMPAFVPPAAAPPPSVLFKNFRS